MTAPDPMSGSLDFLSEGGEMGARIRVHDWAATPLGEPSSWPQSLRSTLSVCLNSSIVSALYWGSEFVLIYNDAYAPALAERHPQALGQPLREVWSELWSVLEPQLERVMETGQGFATDRQRLLMRRHGRMEETYWFYSFAPVRAEGGAVAGVFVNAMDVTSQVDTELKLRERDERQRQVFRQMPGFVAVLKGPEHVYEYVNEAYVTIAGQRSFLGREVRDVFPELEGQGFFELLDQVYTNDEPFSAQGLPLRLAGEDEDRFIDLLYQPIRNDDGVVNGIFVGGYDVTVQNRAIVALRELNETLEQRVAERTKELMLAEDALRQSQKLEAIGQLTGGVAHDFNNLLTVIKSSTDLLKRPDLAEERRLRYVAAISDTVDRAAKLTGQLLAFARRQALRPEVFDAAESVRAISDMMGTLTGSRIHIVTQLPVDPCFMDADPSQFDTALVNMAVNARDAMNGEGHLTIRVEAVEQMPAIRTHAAVVGAFIAVSIIDTGSGIPEERLDHIFEPFFTTKGVGQGTGLGLSQVFGFAKQSGGEVAVTSVVGKGTTFTLYMPSVETMGQVAVPFEPEVLMDGHGTCVLVVEDNAEVGNFAVQTLRDLGYVPVLPTHAEEALAELRRDANRFDVVFTDVVMPGMTGIDLAHEIRRLHHDLPVLLASGYSHVLAQNSTYGFELLHKPYSIENLSRLLRKVATWQRRKRIVGS
ncbi:PAS domain-containing protein [Methylobacterium sp. E-045]|uniref:PAS domain-containing protein n=1 Tax=Methylobacterium sp. E-045 TaxID=2836575 RepID=UPI001FB8A010|nr:PAS domain-containing protein [Methylobacterium sp. E-045]MCJ2129578.1 PAS domain-containing protein [Methylobacterium sp. E-045]